MVCCLLFSSSSSFVYIETTIMSLVPDYDSDSELESEKIEKISIKPKKRKRIIAVDEINSAIETTTGIDTDTETKGPKRRKSRLHRSCRRQK